MRLDFDTYKEILDTITRNKSRSLLTGFGVFWGVFMLIALMSMVILRFLMPARMLSWKSVTSACRLKQ